MVSCMTLTVTASACVHTRTHIHSHIHTCAHKYYPEALFDEIQTIVEDIQARLILSRFP